MDFPMHDPAAAAALAPCTLSTEDVFEGPEKKLEVYFRTSVSQPSGFRQYGAEAWSELLSLAACTILNQRSNDHCDAYLLSESSLFVFADRVILKTCGTTTLLLVLPRLLEMAATAGTALERLQYGHLRYKFPQLQLYPSRSHDEERAYLVAMFGEGVHALTVGPADGCCWHVLAVEGRAAVAAPRPLPAQLNKWQMALPSLAGEDILEVAMEGLSAEVCALFGFERGPDGKDVAGWGPLPDGALARAMTTSCGLADLLPGALIDDWAFEPCGYSMNALAGPYYYTVHVTPEVAFSYASFETNDPRFRAADLVERVVGCFSPSVVTLTLTSRDGTHRLPAYSRRDFERTAASAPTIEHKPLGNGAAVSYATYRAAERRAGLPLVKSFCDGALGLAAVPTPTASPEEA
mmetsp:Transcript_32238/g.95929  ORF Transcript_32238/g.95929 Transcript_32238/m.95929 type:complete len:407 (+) Transcript_32238:82-1302(+)